MKKTLSLDQEKLKTLVREVLEEFFDPDYGLQVRPEIMELLKQSSKEKEKGKGISLWRSGSKPIFLATRNTSLAFT